MRCEPRGSLAALPRFGMHEIRPNELFVFAGAGISRDSGLPLFNEIRDEAIKQLGLARYLASLAPENVGHASIEIVKGLAPEAFLHALEQCDVDVSAWLRVVLMGGRPMMAHLILAELAQAGAAVWTVNFDELIEAASSRPLRTSAWPNDPRHNAEILKPHGTLSGQLIATASAVLSPPAAGWVDRLISDVSNRTVVFVGYSARDADFRPLWTEVLTAAREVVWFDFPDPKKQEQIRRMLRRLADDGRLTFPAEQSAGLPPNPARHFVMWIQEHTSFDALHLNAPIEVVRVDAPLPLIAIESPFGPARFLERLGDAPGARRAYLGSVWRSPLGGLKGAAMVTVNHGGASTAAALRVVRVMSSPFRRSAFHLWVRRKEASIYANLGDHDRVLRLTAEGAESEVSTEVILRCASLRMTSNLDEASRTALGALARARSEERPRPARAANAAFQAVISLLWAYRLDEGRSVLENDLEPLAALAANRWVAWALAMRAALDARIPELVTQNVDLLDRAIHLFLSEGLIDGAISVTLTKSVVLRAGSREAEAGRCVDTVPELERSSGVLYARGHLFTKEVISFERAELCRRRGALDEALNGYASLARSRYPVNASLGMLGESLTLLELGKENAAPAQQAHDVAKQIGARYQLGLAEQLLLGDLAVDVQLLYP